MDRYFAELDRGVNRAYDVAQRARAQGIDPEPKVEIPRAEDMASRVEKLLKDWHLDGIAPRIRELAATQSREDVAIQLALELAADESRGSVAQRLDVALRVGIAILTEGILVAPLEGLVKAEVHPDPAGPYVDLYYAGPIRAAGGTAQALSVLLADLVRRHLGLAAYRPTAQEISRYAEEIPLYKHCQHLQYVPSQEEIRLVVSRLPVCIDGEATEGDQEVSAFRDLPRVGTNGIRGGACLVIAEGLCQKAAKLRKIVSRLKITGWEFLDQLGHQGPAAAHEGSTPPYLAEAVGGRPVLAYPHRPGGFRLVYGRCRTTGLAAAGVNPATMVILRHFVAVGTQVKTELPGKAAAMALCDTVEGPLVLLDDGSFVQVNDRAQAEEVLPRVRRILDLGELLVAYGEFLENNKPLAPGAYSLPWHLELVRSKGLPFDRRALQPTFQEARELSLTHGLPLHPRFNLFWHDLTGEGLRDLARWVEREGHWSDAGLSLPREPARKEQLMELGLLHHERDERLRVEPDTARAFLLGLGLEVRDGGLARRAPLVEENLSALDQVNRLAGIPVKARGPTRIGARVGRPEKAYQRVMKPNVHVLFPVGDAGGAHRSLTEAVARAGEPRRPGPARAPGEPRPVRDLTVVLGVRRCSACGVESVWNRCRCGAHTEPTERTVQQGLPFPEIYGGALDGLHLDRAPHEVKGVKALMSKSRTPEPLAKGILRARWGISVYQDGTARFDLTDLPLTHFRPREAGLSVPAARALGYGLDWRGEPLEREDQLLELLPHDIIVSRRCGEYLLSLAHFLDEELELLYGEAAFYRARAPEDLLGQQVIALAPHTSGGVLGRIVGYTDAEGCFAHPVFHAAKRRNCDGDEDSVTLLLDGLLNFSFAYLPVKRGALMDKPLVLTTRLDAREVDKEAHSVDVPLAYPLTLYEAAEQRAMPKTLEGLIDTLGKRLEQGPRQFSEMGFTHDTTDIAGGPLQSAYREARGMERTVEDTLDLAGQIRAVDLDDAVSLVLNHHFLPDIMGNLKSYATQKFRCKACGHTYRRPPLDRRCGERRGRERCGGELLPTVYPSNVTKYLPMARRLAERYGVSNYLRQRLEVLESSLVTLFPEEPEEGPRTLDHFQEPADGKGPSYPAPSPTVGGGGPGPSAGDKG